MMLLTIVYLVLFALVAGGCIVGAVDGWRAHRRQQDEERERHAREEERRRDAEAAFDALVARLKRQIPYMPLPVLPPMMALPPYDTGGNLPPGLSIMPTYPGDLPALPVLPDDLYPLYEQEFDATVLAALERIGEW